MSSVNQNDASPGVDHGSLSGELDQIDDFKNTTTEGSQQVDKPRIEQAVREILAAVGEDPDREGLLETPARVARMYAEMFSGLHSNPRLQLQKF
ncbi:MAG: GTP cyclohydrolase I, partial [Pirellulales bacterium]|nr:GTP cyclohydrolase I [Pirellulales bacterium]